MGPSAGINATCRFARCAPCCHCVTLSLYDDQFHSVTERLRHCVTLSLCDCATVFQAIPHRGASLMLAQWPSADLPQDKDALQGFDDLRDLVSSCDAPVLHAIPFQYNTT